MKKANFRCLKEDYEGNGLINYNNQFIKINGILKDEEGEFEIEKNSSHPLKLVKIIKRNDKIREKVNCPFYKECTKCKYQGLTYSHELELKDEYIKECFSHFRDFSYLGIEKAYNKDSYRNKTLKAYKLSKAKKVVCGFYVNNNLVSITDCKIEAKKIIEVINKFNIILSKNHIEPYDNYTKKGIIKSLCVRYGFNSKELMLIIETNSEMFPGRNNVVKDLLKEDLNITTIIQTFNKKERVLYGKGFIVDMVCDYKFKITSNSFFPINSLGYEALIKSLINLDLFKETDNVLDIYSNISLLDIVLSNKVNKIYALSTSKEDSYIAKENIRLNQVKNVELIDGRLSEYLVKLKDNKIDTIIINAPSEGLDKDTINKLKDYNAKKLIYISNDIKTLERNAFDLSMSAYSLKVLKGFDLSPRTSQISLVAIFEHKK